MTKPTTIALGTLALLFVVAWVYLTVSSGLRRERMQAFCKGLSAGMTVSEIRTLVDSRDYMYRPPSLGGRIPAVLIDRKAVGFRCELRLQSDRLVSAKYLEGSR
jgi:hypothetical protein